MGHAATSLVHLCKTFGWSVISHNVHILNETIYMILNKTHPCFEYTEDRDLAMDGKEHDDILLDPTTDLIAQLAKTGSELYDESLLKFIPFIIEKINPNRHQYSRAMGLGCLADCFDNNGTVTRFNTIINQLQEVSLLGLSDKYIGARRNAAYLIGNLYKQFASAYTSTLSLKYLSLLDKLVLQVDMNVDPNDEALPVSDNAVSCICKMISSNSITDDQTLTTCISIILRGLPIRADLEETKYVYPVLVSLIENKPNLMTSETFLPYLVHILSQILTIKEANIDQHTHDKLILISKSLIQQMPDQIQQILSQLPVPQQSNFMEAIK